MNDVHRYVKTLRPILLLLGLATAAAGCDTASAPEFGDLDGSLRSAEAKIVVDEIAVVGKPTALALKGDTYGPVVWAVVDHPPDPGVPVGDHPPDPGVPVGDHPPDPGKPVGDHPPDPGEPVGDHPPDPGAVACLAGMGPEAFFVPTVPGVYVLRALVLDAEGVEIAYEVETEVFIESEKVLNECVAGSIPDGILPSIDEVAGIEPTPFYDDFTEEDEVAGIEPTPFALLYGETSVSAGCMCAYE